MNTAQPRQCLMMQSRVQVRLVHPFRLLLTNLQVSAKKPRRRPLLRIQTIFLYESSVSTCPSNSPTPPFLREIPETRKLKLACSQKVRFFPLPMRIGLAANLTGVETTAAWHYIEKADNEHRLFRCMSGKQRVGKVSAEPNSCLRRPAVRREPRRPIQQSHLHTHRYI